jgi:hypothetical protein
LFFTGSLPDRFKCSVSMNRDHVPHPSLPCPALLSDGRTPPSPRRDDPDVERSIDLKQDSATGGIVSVL